MKAKSFPYLTLVLILFLGCKGEVQQGEDPIAITENTILLRISKEEFKE